jgi:ribosomal protein L11 methylase PrmA
VDWLELSVRADAESVEAVAELLRRYSNGGVTIEAQGRPTPDGEDYFEDLTAPVTVRAYIPARRGSSAKQRRIEEGLWHLAQLWPNGGLEVRHLAQETWETSWKANYPPPR